MEYAGCMLNVKPERNRAFVKILRLCAAVLLLLLLTACGSGATEKYEIAATTAPVAQLAQTITEGTGLTVTQVISDSVSCLHDYSLSVRQMEVLTQSDLVLLSGGGLEDFMQDMLASTKQTVDCSEGITLLEADGHGHDEHSHQHEHSHDHEHDPHIWLDPANAERMAQNIYEALAARYPEQESKLQANLAALLERLALLRSYGKTTLAELSCREIITFHDGFAYLARAFELEILAAIEEESGSEASARELVELVDLVEEHHLPAVFTEVNGSSSAASVIQAETGAEIWPLDLAMGGSDYFEAMLHNIDTLKEALQ